MTLELRLHVIEISPPIDTTVEESAQVATEVFGSVGLRLNFTVCKKDLPDLENLSVTGCGYPGTPLLGDDYWHNTAFKFRCTAANRDVVAYFIMSTDPPYVGCAHHPPNRPGVLVAAHATRWTLAHEIGHVLGLSHRPGSDVLMTKSTSSIAVDKPGIDVWETDLIMLSPWLVEVSDG